MQFIGRIFCRVLSASRSISYLVYSWFCSPDLIGLRVESVCCFNAILEREHGLGVSEQGLYIRLSFQVLLHRSRIPRAQQVPVHGSVPC
jgi:hypothetical protein